jgi:hypothetical protein
MKWVVFSSRPSRRVTMTGLLALFGMLGCAPLQTTSYLLDAQVQIEAARTAGAERLSPYEFTSANLYFNEAKDKVAYSEYENAVDYARKASRFANEARRQAMSRGVVDHP